MCWQEKIFASITRKQGDQPHRIKGFLKLNVVNFSVSKSRERLRALANRTYDECMKYDFRRDLIWLLSRPWILVPRFIQIVGAISLLLARLIFQGSSNDDKTQKNLAKFLLKTLIGLGPCFIKVGQALSTRPDLIRKDWLEELTNLQDNLPAFSNDQALQIIESELGRPANELFEEYLHRYGYEYTPINQGLDKE